MLITPNGMTLMGAATLPQLENTSMKQFFEMIPPGMIDTYQKQKNYVDLINGHRVLFRPLDESGKARSLNLSCFHIEEASEVGHDYFVQLQTRLRNHATDHHIGILSTNPDLGWIRSEFLLKSKRIENSERPYFVPEEDKNPDFATHIAPTRLNTYLPPDFYASTAYGKPAFWINRYLNGSFDYSEGAVYADFGDHLIEPFDIKSKIQEEGWRVIAGCDFGILDPTILVMGAIDPDTGIVYIYDEYYKTGEAVPYHATEMKKLLEPIPYGSLMKIMADPAGKKRSFTDGRSLYDHYGEYGIFFQQGNNRIEAGIAKVQAYFALGKLKIFRTCSNTVREGINYKYKPVELSSEKNRDENPIDKDNHTLDGIRYMINELPDDPNRLKAKGYNPFAVKNKKNTLHYALQTDDRNTYDTQDWYNRYY